MTLNARSVRNTQGVHPDMMRVLQRAIEIEQFTVTQGLRTLAEQKENIKKGVSWSLNSRHLTGHAVDVCDPDGCYDLPDMIRIGKAIKQAANELNVPVIWGALKKHGGDWKTRNDTPHFELDAKVYPANAGIPKTEYVKQAAEVAASARVVGGVATGTGLASLPSLPSLPAVPDLAPLTAWQGFGEQVSGLLSWGYQNPMITGCLALWLGASYFLPSIVERFTWSRS
jgi:peptidoglycan LD-endopeptidase CwlK